MIKRITEFIRSFRQTEAEGEAIDLTYGKLKVQSTVGGGDELDFNEKARHVHREMCRIKGVKPKF
jgi:hypothetical protein